MVERYSFIMIYIVIRWRLRIRETILPCFRNSGSDTVYCVIMWGLDLIYNRLCLKFIYEVFEKTRFDNNNNFNIIY